MPEGKPPPTGLSIPNAISQTLQAYPPEQLADILSNLKAVATNNPEQGILAVNKDANFTSEATVDSFTTIGLCYFSSHADDEPR